MKKGVTKTETTRKSTSESAKPRVRCPKVAEPPTSDTTTLAAIGLSETQACVYETLVDHPGSNAVDITQRLELSRREVAAAIAHLTQLGLISHSAERAARYHALRPDIVIEALIGQRQRELESVRAHAVTLAARMHRAISTNFNEEPMVEVLAGSEASKTMFSQLQAAAQHEVLEVERPPYVVGSSIDGAPDQMTTMRRNVPYRVVMASSALEVPGRLAVLRKHLAVGEQTRVLPTVPIKYLLVDRRVAMMPLYPDEPARAMLLVRSPALIAALHELFESLWVRAAPIRFSESSRELLTEASKPGPVSGSEEMIALLAAGLNDKSTAHQLGMSSRTFHRRIEVLLANLDARTRFQAGWNAALRSAKAKSRPRA